MDIIRKNWFKVKDLEATDLDKYEILCYKKQDPLIEIQDKYRDHFQLLIGAEYPNSPKRFYMITTWEFWMNNIANIEYKKGNHFYEILKSEEPCYLYFDIDGEEEFNTDNFFNNIIPSIIEKLEKYFNRKIAYPYILTSTTPSKESYHLIFRDVICGGTYACMNLLREINVNFPGFDESVYSSRRNMRLLNSNKSTSKTIKPFLKYNYKDEPIENFYATIKNPDEHEIHYNNNQFTSRSQKNRTGSNKRVKRNNYEQLEDNDKSKMNVYINILKKKFPGIREICDFRRDGDTIKLRAKGIKCINKKRCHRNNWTFITIFEPKEDIINSKSNLPVVYVYCKHPNCIQSGVISIFKIY